MKRLGAHMSRCFLAGFVALLPIGGLVLTVGYLEALLSDAGVGRLPFYFPGLGLLLATLAIYLVGLLVTTFIGNWAWRLVDRLLHRLPALGSLYATLKQILGYGEGEDAMFLGAVLVPARDGQGEEIGLVTRRFQVGAGGERVMVFVPGAPNPAAGRLLVIPAAAVREVTMPVGDALKTLVAVGKNDLDPAQFGGGTPPGAA